MEQEQGGENTKNNNRGEDKQAGAKALWSVTGTAIAIQIYLMGVFFLWVFIPDYVQDRSEASKVFIESGFSLAIVIVIVIHAIMYYKQAKEANEQVEISTTALVVSNQSYVGIESIADRELLPSGKTILIKIENIGRIPADQIRVSMYLKGLLIDRTIDQEDVRPEFVHEINEHFGRTKLFPGRLKIEIPLPYDKYVSKAEYDLIDDGRMAFYAWGKIIYKDDFGDGKETEFSFYHSKTGSRWLIAAPWSPDVQILEHQKRSYPKKRNPN